MRKLILGLAVLALFVVSKPLAAQTTYTQTTHACTLTGCSDAQFTPSSTLSYLDHAQTCGQKDFSGSAVWNGTTYEDFIGSITWVGYTYKGHNYYPDGIYQLTATFNNGTISVTETMRTYRGCSGGYNLDGTVTVN